MVLLTRDLQVTLGWILLWLLRKPETLSAQGHHDDRGETRQHHWEPSHTDPFEPEISELRFDLENDPGDLWDEGGLFGNDAQSQFQRENSESSDSDLSSQLSPEAWWEDGEIFGHSRLWKGLGQEDSGDRDEDSRHPETPTDSKHVLWHRARFKRSTGAEEERPAEPQVHCNRQTQYTCQCVGCDSSMATDATLNSTDSTCCQATLDQELQNQAVVLGFQGAPNITNGTWMGEVFFKAALAQALVSSCRPNPHRCNIKHYINLTHVFQPDHVIILKVVTPAQPIPIQDGQSASPWTDVVFSVLIPLDFVNRTSLTRTLGQNETIKPLDSGPQMALSAALLTSLLTPQTGVLSAILGRNVSQSLVTWEDFRSRTGSEDDVTPGDPGEPEEQPIDRRILGYGGFTASFFFVSCLCGVKKAITDRRGIKRRNKERRLQRRKAQEEGLVPAAPDPETPPDGTGSEETPGALPNGTIPNYSTTIIVDEYTDTEKHVVQVHKDAGDQVHGNGTVVQGLSNGVVANGVVPNGHCLIVPTPSFDDVAVVTPDGDFEINHVDKLANGHVGTGSGTLGRIQNGVLPNSVNDGSTEDIDGSKRTEENTENINNLKNLQTDKEAKNSLQAPSKDIMPPGDFLHSSGDLTPVSSEVDSVEGTVFGAGVDNAGFVPTEEEAPPLQDGVVPGARLSDNRGSLSNIHHPQEGYIKELVYP